MKKILIVFCVLMGVLFNSAVVKADVIWTPEDSFFMEHEEDCVFVRRCFLANAPGGEVIVQESPVETKEVTRIKNGTQVWVEWTYEDADGIVWGTYDGWFDGNKSGWMSLEYMHLIYDYISFEEDHVEDIKDQSGQLDSHMDMDSIFAWSYPGAATCWEMQMDPENAPTYDKVYQDEEGRMWGFCSYYYGNRNFWMCLDNVLADHEELYGYKPVESTPEIDESNSFNPVTETENDKQVDKGPDRSQIMIGIAVGGVVIVTAIVLAVMKKKMKKGM